ncbi:C40 family peptidase [Litoribacter ruber]|uniref:C40 family peptidase n=1 Tax=Litoribacter ruber TaxID=702568 RepID=A0AAP2CII9_9BACT|nr:MULTISPECIES: C40 family peptidase [Litoribacter]MBS9522492.1 C40 family peptidase [Litoribacter alkaliphilus]MBT0811012.1 C40 family peptidase [Litoribacter ruber]
MRTIISSTSKFQLLFLVFIVLLSSSCSSSRKVRKKNIDQVVSTAKSFHGTPYRFGGTTRAGMDCSALLLHSFSSVGVTLPRTSEAQSKIGRRVTVQSLKKGDVVFFATGRKRRQVTHAGIVTSNNRGNIQFIHASTSLGVTEDAINSDYWSKKFVVGRRVF